jgi:hypothetical protein
MHLSYDRESQNKVKHALLWSMGQRGGDVFDDALGAEPHKIISHATFDSRLIRRSNKAKTHICGTCLAVAT